MYHETPYLSFGQVTPFGTITGNGLSLIKGYVASDILSCTRTFEGRLVVCCRALLITLRYQDEGKGCRAPAHTSERPPLAIHGMKLPIAQHSFEMPLLFGNLELRKERDRISWHL